MKMNTLPKEVLEKAIEGWARASGTNGYELETWYNDDIFNGFQMKDYLTLDEYKTIWLKEDKKMDEFFKEQEQQYDPFASKPEITLTDEEYEVLIGIRCPNCNAKLEDGDIVLCDKCYNEAVCDIDEKDLPF